MITFSNIVDRFETFVEKHFFLKSFSFGSPEDLDLDKFENFPLCHLVYTSGSYADKVKSYTLEVYILDCPRGEDSRKEFEKDTITQCEMAAEDILADLENGGNIFDFDFAYQLESASITPLEEMETNVLSGTLLQISIGVPYLYDTCNAPLTGVSPQGTNTSFSARGLLRVKEVDGSPDVTTVKTINVSNGTLTDNGSGEVTIDTAGTTTTAGLVGTYKYTSSLESKSNTTGSLVSGVINVAPHTDLTFDNRNLVGPQHFVHNFPLGRRELHGLTSGTTVRVKYTLEVTHSTAGLIAITSTASNPAFSETLVVTDPSTQAVTLDGTFTNLTTTSIFLNLSVLSNCINTVKITAFELVITQPS